MSMRPTVKLKNVRVEDTSVPPWFGKATAGATFLLVIAAEIFK